MISTPSRQRHHRTSLGSTDSSPSAVADRTTSEYSSADRNNTSNNSRGVIGGRKDIVKRKRGGGGGFTMASDHSYYTFGQLVSFAAICSSLAVVLTALIAAGFFFPSGSDSAGVVAGNHNLLLQLDNNKSRLGHPNNKINNEAVATSVSNDSNNNHHHHKHIQTSQQREHERAIAGVLPQTQFRYPTTKLSQQQQQDVTVATADNKAHQQQGNDENNNKGTHPQVAWLISFPNSGTSFTIHMTREASNCTTATNYALEGDVKDKPSIPAIPGPAGKNGPWLELIPNRHTSIPNDVILTKTHCKGFCSGRYCGPDKTIQTVRSFQIGCLSGTRAVMKTKNGGKRLEKVSTTYSPSLVKKAIHIFRHPLDNIVARFHLEYNVQAMKGNTKYAEAFPKNATGFKRWCALDDANRGLLNSRFIDRPLRKMLGKVPCFNEFYRYTMWHNLAFSMSHDMNIPTMILHYHEYSTDFEGTRNRVLNFLGLPLVGTGIEFHSGKIYRSYYSQDQKKAIRALLQELASVETWEQLKDYDFEINNNGGETAAAVLSATK